NGLRDYYLKAVRPPSTPRAYASPETGHPLMPFLCGDNCFVPGVPSSTYLTVTDTQYFFLQQWARGAFTVGATAPEPAGRAIDRAAIENCVGGAFSPGIEMTWISRNPQLYCEPFRFKPRQGVRPPLSLGGDLAQGLEPGDVGKYMACPWQADFNECSQEQVGERFVWWWPVQRPDFVHVRNGDRLKQVAWVGTDQDQNAPNYVEFSDDIDMVTKWKELGFVFNEGTEEHPVFVEVARRLKRHEVAAGVWGDAPDPE
ncbi:MAG: LodA/GoxA family CTQ-dependent oxidase, partial [Planctomycetia bacterium]|nr:LodA/GoxA family CTQ-dependent oxidase [Planctomycetia bacterium]